MLSVARIACLLACLAGVVTSAWAYLATVNKTDYQEIHIVPAPGKIAIDGDLKDWDLSGAIEMCMDEASRATMSLTGAYMYDQEAFYVGGHVKDPTPMMNQHDLASDMNLCWDADCVELRLISNPAIKSKASLQTKGAGTLTPEQQRQVCHFDLWYSTRDQKPVFMIRYGMYFVDQNLNPPEVQGAYKKDADGKGYAFEYRVPWKLLRLEKPWQDGDQVQTQWQIQWSDARGDKAIAGMTDVRVKDSMDLGYMGPNSWGLGIVHGTGHLKLPKKTTIERAQGHIPITFTLAQATKVSLAVTDKAGRIVRTCLGAEPMEAGKQTYLWDGLDDYDRPVPAGEYRWKLLTQEGFEQKYVCNVGVSGNPPYQNDAGTGGWAGDYGAPQYVDVDGDLVVLGTGKSEAATATLGTTLDGQRQWGAWWGAQGLWALEKGTGYFTGYASELSRFDAREGKIKPFADGRGQIRMTSDGKPVNTGAGGLTVVDGRLVVVSANDRAIYLVDPETAAVKEKLPLEGAGWGAATGPKGELYVVANGRIGRYDLQAKAFTPLTDPLSESRMLDCDAAGNIYACIQGTAMQVWKFAPDGKLLQKIGKEGGRPRVGKFDPAGMLNPHDVAVDKNGRIWVAECDQEPKRYSVWNADGTLWKDFFGSLVYSSTAFVDPAKPEEVHVGTVRYRVDFEKGTWSVDRLLPRWSPWQMPKIHPGEKERELGFPMYAGGQREPIIATMNERRFIFTADYGTFAILEFVGDDVVPRLHSRSHPNVNGNTRATWADANNDGQFQPEEINTSGIYQAMDSRLNLYFISQGSRWANQGGSWSPLGARQPYAISRVKFTGFNEKGGPTWAFDKPEVVATESAGGEGGQISGITVDGEGRIFVLVSTGNIKRGQRVQSAGHRLVAFDAQGKKLWSYHNVFCAFAWTSDAYTPGHIVGAFDMIESTTRRLVGVTGYYGQYFLLDKETGLFVAALGQDQRTAYTHDDTMVLTENFNGTLWNNPKTGKTYLSGGDADCRIWELKGFEDYKIREGKVTVAAAQVAQAEQNAEQAKLADRAAMGLLKEATLKKLARATADGNFSEWNGIQPQMIAVADKRMAQAQLGYDDRYLWLRFQVADESPLRNQATDYRLLFKTGDALDIQFCTDMGTRKEHGQNQQEMRVGDARILVTRTHEDKMVATIIRYRTPDKEKPKQNEYSSAVWKETVDEVSDLNDLPMHCKAEKDSYAVEVGIPWSVIGLTPKPGMKLKGDIGLIYGNDGGTKNAVRYLWSDKTPALGVNNDVPTEMRMHPNDLGTWTLE